VKRGLPGILAAAMAVVALSGGFSGGPGVRVRSRSSEWEPAPWDGPVDTGGHRQRTSRHERKRRRAKSLAWKGGA